MREYKPRPTGIVRVDPYTSFPFVHNQFTDRQSQSGTLAYSFSFSKRSNTSPCFSFGMPHPVSVTEKTAICVSSFTEKSNVILPRFVNLLALDSRLIITCCIRCTSVTIRKDSKEVVNKNWFSDDCREKLTDATTWLHNCTTSHSSQVSVTRLAPDVKGREYR